MVAHVLDFIFNTYSFDILVKNSIFIQIFKLEVISDIITSYNHFWVSTKGGCEN